MLPVALKVPVDLNRMKADVFAGFTDRLIPVATIPMHTPREAIDELEFAVRDLAGAVNTIGQSKRRGGDRSSRLAQLASLIRPSHCRGDVGPTRGAPSRPKGLGRR
jgi:hypothetical protein